MRHLVINRYFYTCKLFLFFWFGAITPFGVLSAETITVSLRDLQAALDDAGQGSDPIARDVFAKVSSAISASELGLVDGELIYSDSDSNVTVEGGCNRTVILRIDTDITLNADTSLSLSLESLYDPVVISFDVIANINSLGEAQQIVGIRLGRCQNLATDSFTFKAIGPAQFSLDATLMLNPEWTSESTLSLFPKVTLNGELKQFAVSVDVDDTILAKILESFIQDRLSDTFSNSRFVQELSGIEANANESLVQSFDDRRIDIELPEANDEQIIALYQFLQPEARFPITLDMIRTNRQKILSSMLFGEPSSAQSIFSDALLCETASAFLSSANPLALYEQSGNQCTAVNSETATEGRYWSDESCSNAIDYSPTSMSEYCTVALDADQFGNAALLGVEPASWTTSPGTRLNIGALSLDQLAQPLMRRYKYKTIETASGVCELEMRVYSGASNLESRKPLLALHGGSWQYRASGFIGVEATAMHFTNNGFVVFAPFYRLIGGADGNVACNNADLAEILDDVNDAMDWVDDHADEFRLNAKTTLFGQSAGGHLALSLAVNRPDDVRRAVLLYAPSDFKDFAAQMKSGAYTNQAGLKILETVTGNPIDMLDTQSALVVDNSFPTIIAPAPSTFPPMFILHGEMDSLLPFRQSVRLCNALSGSEDPNIGPASLMPNIAELSSTTVCNVNGSTLHLIAEGEHALDLCLAPELCLSGGVDSTERVAQSMSAMLAWSSAPSVDLRSGSSGTRTGLGEGQWLLLLLISGALMVRRNDLLCN